MSPGAKTEAMKQQPLPFTTRRSATANAKGKGIKSPATEPSTPASVAVKAEDVQEPVLPADDEVTPKTSVKRRSQRRKPQDAEVEATSSKKRKLQEVDESPSSKAKGKGNGKADRVKRVFKSRVSVENTEDGQASPRRDADSSDVDSPADLDTSEKAKKQRLLRHYAEVRTKMGHLEPSEFPHYMHSVALDTEPTLVPQSTRRDRRRSITSFVSSTCECIWQRCVSVILMCDNPPGTGRTSMAHASGCLAFSDGSAQMPWD